MILTILEKVFGDFVLLLLTVFFSPYSVIPVDLLVSLFFHVFSYSSFL
jgi:hypothetical protein